MTELAIHGFSLSLVREGGCGWGVERERIFAAMQHALPAAIAETFATRLEAHGDLSIADPIRLDVRVSLAELVAACSSTDAMAMLARQIVAAWTPPAVDAASERARIDAAIEHRAIEPAIAGDARDPIVATLLAWHRRGELLVILAGFSTNALRRWIAAIVPALPGVDPAVVETLVREDHGTPRSHDPPARDVLRDVLAELVPIVADLHIGSPAASPAGVIARGVARMSATPPLEDAAPETREPPFLATRAAHSPKPRTHAATPPRIATSASIEGFALPFLLLRPLGQIGWLDVVAATCAANELAPPAFAAALALAVLRAPDRGWRHDPVDLATAAAFAGETALPAFAFGDARDLVTPIDRVLARAVLAGHDARRALLLHRSSDGFLLVEPEGLFPIAWQETLDDLLTVASPITSMLAVTQAAADVSTLAALDARNLRFLTDAAPSRHERWRRLEGARAWTNDHIATDELLVPYVSVLPLAEDVDELVDALASRRGRDLPPSVARSASLAAAVALGDVAHRLWRDREPTSPQLALARFGDLSARILLAPDRIDVRIPFGARHRDLDRAGFLAAPTIPWLGGRSLTIGGG